MFYVSVARQVVSIICLSEMTQVLKIWAIIFYFQYSFQEIRIINMYVIIHGSVIIHMCSKAVWWTMRVIQFICKLLNSFHFNVFICTNTCFIYPLIRPWGFQYYNIAFYRKCRRNLFHFNISLIELHVNNNWTYQRVYKTCVGANKNIEIK